MKKKRAPRPAGKGSRKAPSRLPADPRPRGPGAATSAFRQGVRRKAIEVLSEAEASGVFIDEAFAARAGEIEERDRHLLQEIVYGTTRHRKTLDHLLDHYLKMPVARQEPSPRWALRLAAYQLVYLGRIPPHAAVDQTLEGLKGLPGVRARDIGFVNAVLHNLARDVRKKTAEPPLEADDPTVLPIRQGWCHLARPVLPLRRMDPVGHIAIRHSFPEWLVERWLARFGDEETRLLCDAQNRTRSPTARVTRRAPSREALLESLAAEGREAEPGNLVNSIVIRRSGDLASSGSLAKGWLQVQDETAIGIGAVLSPPSGARVLDLCAAPGGKATQLLESVGETGHVVAADRSEEKLALVRENLGRFGANFTTRLLPETPAEMDLGETFSHILLDAPCSNTGVLGRRADARWRIRREDLSSLSELQAALLEAALRHLAPGGRLVYATCSIEPEENEDVVALAFGRDPALIERDTRLFLPHRVPGDGGFYSLILRTR